SLDARTASLTYIAHLGLNALQRAGFQAGETVAVQGLGPIGLATVLLVRLLGGQAIAIGNAPERLAIATALGATVALNASDPALMNKLSDVTETRLCDIVVTTVNAW